MGLAQRLRIISTFPREDIQREDDAMSQRETNLLWLRDTLEQLAACQQRLEWTEDAEAVGVLTQTMLRDLDRCRRLCLEVQRRSQFQTAA